MSPRERVLAAFEGKATDKVPVHHIGFSGKVASQILGREAYVGGGIQQWREAKALWEGENAHQEYLERSVKDAFDVSKVMGHDILRLQYWRMPQKPSAKKDEYTYVYGDPDGDCVVRRFDPETELYQTVGGNGGKSDSSSSFEDLEKHVAAREASVESYTPEAVPSTTGRLMAEYGKEYVVRVGCGGIGIPHGDSLWLEAMLLEPELVGRFLDTQVDMAVKQLEGLAGIGVKMVFGGSDFASNQGTFYSPRTFHELMLPRLRKFSDACHRLGIYHLFASDGNLWPVADDLFGASGVDGYYEVDRRAGMDLGRLKEKFPRLRLIGNISSQTVHLGTREEVAEEAASCIEDAKKYGGIVVGASNYLLPGTPDENLHAMIDTIEKCR